MIIIYWHRLWHYDGWYDAGVISEWQENLSRGRMMPNPKSEERDAQLPNPKSPNATCHANSTLAVSSSPSSLGINLILMCVSQCGRRSESLWKTVDNRHGKSFTEVLWGLWDPIDILVFCVCLCWFCAGTVHDDLDPSVNLVLCV